MRWRNKSRPVFGEAGRELIHHGVHPGIAVGSGSVRPTNFTWRRGSRSAHRTRKVAIVPIRSSRLVHNIYRSVLLGESMRRHKAVAPSKSKRFDPSHNLTDSPLPRHARPVIAGIRRGEQRMNRREFIDVSVSTAAAMSLAVPPVGGENATDNRVGGSQPVKVSQSIATRTEVAGTHGIATGGHEAEAAAGIAMIQARGNAIDALVAAASRGASWSSRPTVASAATAGSRSWLGREKALRHLRPLRPRARRGAVPTCSRSTAPSR